MEETRKNELKTQLTEAMKNENLANALTACTTLAEAQRLLNENGVQITLEEVAYIHSLGNAKNTVSEELTEDDLEDVAGGIAPVVIGMGIFIGLTALGVAIGWKAAGGCKKR